MEENYKFTKYLESKENHKSMIFLNYQKII